ncbi:uncharacterized protein PG998_004545 [Apiospora kogelbergensis]|uniref:uncharacterized protein n=1 Tax=Apiospora kogelbergensis TaxID=1337665 RepID=UPI00312F5FD0
MAKRSGGGYQDVASSHAGFQVAGAIHFIVHLPKLGHDVAEEDAEAVAYFTQEVPIDATTFDMDVANVTDGCGDSQHLLEHAVGRLEVQSGIFYPVGAGFASGSAADGKFS